MFLKKRPHRISLTIKWKNFAAVYGSAATFKVWSHLSRPSVGEKLSMSISCPAKNCAIGSWVSDGFMVSQSNGGPRITLVDQIWDWICVRDLSVPITLAQTAVSCDRKACTLGLEKGSF